MASEGADPLDALLERLEELESKATPGPWTLSKKTVGHCLSDEKGDGDYTMYQTFLRRGTHDDAVYSRATVHDRKGSSLKAPLDPDGLLISESRNALKALLAIVREQRAALEGVEQHLKTTFPPYSLGGSPFDRVRQALAPGQKLARALAGEAKP